MEQRPDLKRIAIVSIDLSGYSRMMEQDEFGTHRAVMKCLNEELVPMVVAQYRGDLVKSTGDGALITFPSATEAVAGMIAFQQRMAWLGRECPHDRRLVFRVGIHLAHAISEDGDLYGNGVNLAVRLQEAAEPGSILVSQCVNEHLTDDAQLKLVYIGKKLLKNIKTPIRLHIWSEEALFLPKLLGSRLAIAAILVFAVCVTPLSTIFSNHIEHHVELSHGDIEPSQLQSTIVKLPGIANFDVRSKGETSRDLYYQAWAHYGRNTNQDLNKAIKYLDQIVLDNPDDNASHALLAAAYWSAWYNRWETEDGLTASEALTNARQHLENVKEPTAVAHMVASEMLTASGRLAEAIVEAERAIAQEPDLGVGYYSKGLALIYYGEPAAAEVQMRIANRLDPYTSRYLFGLAFAQFNMDQIEAAIQTLNRAIDLNSKDDWTYLLLAASSSLLGRYDDARLALDRFNELGMNRLGWVSNHLRYVHSWPFKNHSDLQRLQRGVRLAALKSQYQVAAR